MRNSDTEVLKQFGYEWVAQSDAWSRQLLYEYLAAGRFPQPHSGLLRGILQTAVEREYWEVMAYLFVGVDRSIRRGRIVQTKSSDSRQVSRESLRVPRQPVISVEMRGWLRRQVCTWFEKLGEQDSHELLRATCAALAQYTDEDFKTAERILDNYCLLRTCFAKSPALVFGPVHTQVVDGYSLNDLEPSPESPADWESSDASGQLITLAARSPAAFVRWWSTEQFARASRASTRVGSEAIVQLVACSDENLTPMIKLVLQQQAAEFSPTVWQQLLAESAATHVEVILDSFETLHRQRSLSAAFLTTLCCRLPDRVSSRIIATLARLLRTNHEPFQSSQNCIPFLKLMLESAGCSRSRPWLVEQLLGTTGDDMTAGAAIRQYVSDQLPHLSPTARLDYIAAMHRYGAELPVS